MATFLVSVLLAVGAAAQPPELVAEFEGLREAARAVSRSSKLGSSSSHQSKQRPAALLSRDGDDYSFGNVRWDLGRSADGAWTHSWASATIRLDAVEAAYLVLKPFDPEKIAAHSFFVFTFKDGGLEDGAGRRSRALVLSVEAYLRLGQEYNLAAGLGKAFDIAWILMTWENYAAEACRQNGERLQVYRLELSAAQTRALLAAALEGAAVDRAGEHYHTTRNNCTNNLIRLLNKVIAKPIPEWTIPRLIYNVRATMPVWVPKMLQERGLLSERLAEVTAGNLDAFRW